MLTPGPTQPLGEEVSRTEHTGAGVFMGWGSTSPPKKEAEKELGRVTKPPSTEGVLSPDTRRSTPGPREEDQVPLPS